MRRIILLTVLAIMAAPATANATVGLAIPSSPQTNCLPNNCFGGYNTGTGWGHSTINGTAASTIRGVRAKILLTNTNFNGTDSNSFLTSWVGISNTSGGTRNSTFIQAGIIKGNFAPAPGCDGNTSGNVQVFWYAIAADNTLVDCGLGQVVSGSEGHNFTLQRNDSGTAWGFYLDGTLQHTWTGVGTFSTMNTLSATDECASGTISDCKSGGSIFGTSDFGGDGSNASPNLSITPNGHSCGCGGWVNVRNSDAVLVENGGSLVWDIDSINPGTP